jgi:hypothetical protein
MNRFAGVCKVTKPVVTSVGISVAATVKLSPSPKAADGPMYVKVSCFPSGLSAAEKPAWTNAAALVEIAPNETSVPPAMFSAKVNVSPCWSCWVEFGLALRTEN